LDKYGIACRTQIYKKIMTLMTWDTTVLTLHVWNDMMVRDRYGACGTLMSDQQQELTFH